jgi:alkylhydroperoxidase family enzyme
MISWMIRRSLNKFEREFGYDATYLREVLEVSPEAMIRFSSVGAISSYRRDLPLDVYHAAKITAALHADCGPCAQLVTTFAERDGVDPEVLRAVVRGEAERLAEPVRLAVAYANAVLSRSMEIDVVREQLEARYGARGVISLSFAIMSSQLYPTLKYALGHGKTCVAVEVGGEKVDRHDAGRVHEGLPVEIRG